MAIHVLLLLENLHGKTDNEVQCSIVKKKHRLTWNTFVGKDSHAIDMTTYYKHKYLQSYIAKNPPFYHQSGDGH